MACETTSLSGPRVMEEFETWTIGIQDKTAQMSGGAQTCQQMTGVQPAWVHRFVIRPYQNFVISAVELQARVV